MQMCKHMKRIVVSPLAIILPSKLKIKCKAPPPLLIYNLGTRTLISKTIKVKDNTGGSTILSLRGVIYLGENYLTAWIILPDKSIWYYNGENVGRISQYEGSLTSFTKHGLMKYKAISAIYVH